MTAPATPAQERAFAYLRENNFSPFQAVVKLLEEREWRNISTMPTDGRLILIGNDVDKFEQPYVAFWQEGYYDDNGDWYVFDGQYHHALIDAPTHWKPLDYPKQTNQKDAE